jgi:hypothetical protein
MLGITLAAARPKRARSALPSEAHDPSALVGAMSEYEIAAPSETAFARSKNQAVSTNTAYEEILISSLLHAQR